MTRKAKFRFEELPIQEYNISFPNLRKVRLHIRSRRQIYIPRVSACNTWKRFVDFENKVVMFAKSGTRKKKNLQLPMLWSVIYTMGWEESKEPRIGNVLEVFRYMPNKDKVYIFQNKELLLPIREMEEGKR